MCPLLKNILNLCVSLNSLSVPILVLIFETHSALCFFDHYVTIGCYYTTHSYHGPYPGPCRSLS